MKISVIIQKNGVLWDAQVVEHPNIVIIGARTISEARVFVDILAREELGKNFFVKKEIINYEQPYVKD